MTDAREKLEANPRFTWMWHQLGTGLAFRGRFREALDAFATFRSLSSLREDRESLVECLVALLETAAERVETGAPEGDWTWPDLAAARRAPWPRPLESLHEAGLSDEEARPWVREHFDAKSAAPWIDAGVDARNAKLFGVKGFDPVIARALIDRGLTPSARTPVRGAEDLAAWEAAGLGLDDALGAGDLALEEVVGWREAGFPIGEVSDWKRERIEPAVAGAWRSVGAGPREARDWARAGIGPGGVAAWEERSFRAPAAGRWRAAGFDPADARAWLDVGVADEEATAWRAARLGPADCLPWRHHGFRPADRSLWRSAGFELEEAYGWRSRGFTADEANAERAAGSTPQEAAERRRFEGLPHEPVGHKGLLFWGLVFTEPDRLPWGTDGEERYADQWRDRFRRLAPDVDPDELGCVLGPTGSRRPSGPTTSASRTRWSRRSTVARGVSRSPRSRTGGATAWSASARSCASLRGRAHLVAHGHDLGVTE